MKNVIEKYFDDILILIGIIVAIITLAWMVVSVVNRVNDQNAIKENNNTEEFIANIEACTKSDIKDIKDCILLTIDDK